MMISLKTHDGLHYLCAEPDGRVVADRTAVGEWEQWTVVTVRPGVIGLRSAHGRFLSAQPDGSVVADREHLNGWEEWNAALTPDGGVGLKGAHGWYLVAEEGGGGEVRANRDGLGPWETFTPSDPLGASVPPAGPLLPLRVEAGNRYFESDHGRYDWREITAFALLAYYQHGRADEARQWMQAARTLGFTQGRVLATYTIGADVIGHAGPDQPGYWEAVAALCADARALGFRLRWTIFGALEPFGAVWVHSRPLYFGDVQRRGDAFAMEFVERVIGPFPECVFELANEPVNIGFNTLGAALVSLGRRLRDKFPSMVLAFGDVNGMTLADAFDAAFSHVDSHVDRNPEMRFMHAHKRLGEMDFRDNQPRPMPASSGEPYNAGAPRRDGLVGGSQGACPYPVTAFAHAAMCRVRQILPTFHMDEGLYCTPLQPETVACAQAFQAALDAIPMPDGRRWRGQHGLGAGDYWRDVWPNTDDLRDVERHVRDGRGPWRANGIGPWSVVFPEPLGWDYQANTDAPAERIAYMADDAWGVGIYRRV
jgi:hypothetical protein